MYMHVHIHILIKNYKYMYKCQDKKLLQKSLTNVEGEIYLNLGKCIKKSLYNSHGNV